MDETAKRASAQEISGRSTTSIKAATATDQPVVWIAKSALVTAWITIDSEYESKCTAATLVNSAAATTTATMVNLAVATTTNIFDASTTTAMVNVVGRTTDRYEC